MENLVITCVSAGKDGANTQTPGRKYVTLYFQPKTEGNVLNTEKVSPRVMHEDGEIINSDGSKSVIKAPPLMKSILQVVKTTDWKLTEPGTHSETFNQLLGMEVIGESVSEYVEPYEIEGSLSSDKRRVVHTTTVFKGETASAVFLSANKIIASPSRINAIKEIEAEINTNNLIGKHDRQVARGGKGFLNSSFKKSLQLETQGALDPAMK